MTVRRVAVVGAGSSGLACIKICIDEGLEPVCFESSDDIGGLWRFKVEATPERSSIYRGLVVNTSKEMMCFSDFPTPADFPNYMHNSQLLQYFRLYAEHFNLLKHIHFQTTVKSVTQTADFSETGQWEVVTINKNGDWVRHVFDAVLVCSGHYTHPLTVFSESFIYFLSPLFNFSGRCFHSWEYKDADAYRGKRVVVVGIGNSGGDIAVEISRSAEKTFLSSRKGAWVVGRMSTNGLPLDMTAITRFSYLLTLLLPKALINWLQPKKMKYTYLGLSSYPFPRLLDRSPLINDDLPGRVLLGGLVMKANLRGFVDSGVVFEDGTVEENIDAVVFCTGYRGTFPFLPPALSQGPYGELTLYKSPLKKTFLNKSEMQARWAVKVFTGKTLHTVLHTVTKGGNVIGMCVPLRFDTVTTFITKDTVILDFYLQVGVRPNFLLLLLRDPVLWVKVVFGPCTPYQYRLTGPGQWAGARHAILTQWKRVAQPFKTRAAHLLHWLTNRTWC
uniref:Flavin-containing monooxygenase n=1 Tax=Echeneis naucrates TaxID=173247 RepID=A0A665UVN2_ECHNA